MTAVGDLRYLRSLLPVGSLCTQVYVHKSCSDGLQGQSYSALVYQQKTAQRGTKQPLHLLLYVVWTHHEHIIPLKHACMLGS